MTCWCCRRHFPTVAWKIRASRSSRPTIIAGDKSLVILVAHELAHSWSGNLVTNATWSDFWLNEGFTVYFEGRIMERVYGAAAAEMNADLGWDTLQEVIKLVGGMKSAGHAPAHRPQGSQSGRRTERTSVPEGRDFPAHHRGRRGP